MLRSLLLCCLAALVVARPLPSIDDICYTAITALQNANLTFWTDDMIGDTNHLCRVGIVVGSVATAFVAPGLAIATLVASAML